MTDVWSEYAEWAAHGSEFADWLGLDAHRAARNIAFGLAIVAAYHFGSMTNHARVWFSLGGSSASTRGM